MQVAAPDPRSPARGHGDCSPDAATQGRPGGAPREHSKRRSAPSGEGHSPFRSSRSHTVTMGRECLRWWMSHRDKVCTLCCELLNSDSFFSSAASEKADIPPKTRPRRPTQKGQKEENSVALVAASPTHPTLLHALTAAAASTTSKSGRKLARWRPAGSDVTAGACPAPPAAGPGKSLGREAEPPGGRGGPESSKGGTPGSGLEAVGRGCECF